MFLDALLKVSAAQAFTGAATVSTSSIDLGNVTPKREIGTGEAMSFLFTIDVAAGAGSTHTFDVIDSPNADLSAGTVLATRVFAAATLVAGYVFEIEVPVATPTQRYLGIKNTSTGGTTTVTASAVLVPRKFVQAYKSYAKGYTIS